MDFQSIEGGKVTFDGHFSTTKGDQAVIDTAGTICSAVDTLIAAGASDVRCATTHAIFSGPAIDRLKNSRLSEVIVTNTIPLPPEKQFPGLKTLSVAGVFADALKSVFEDTSVSEIFDGENNS